MDKCDIGIFGLGLMGQNLTINFANRGFSVSVFNRKGPGEENVLKDFIADRCHQKRILGASTVKDFVNSIARPRKIIVLVKAGPAVDDVIECLLPHLEAGDIVIDGGNSHYRDTARRISKLEPVGLLFVGCGISGGGEGALHGPSIMPGGPLRAWDTIRPFLQAIAAKDTDGVPCCDWIGPEGAGHFVKMVHNGIEYALMALLAESYDIMKRQLSMPIEEISSIMSKWNAGELRSYLLGITCDILALHDTCGRPLLENILDCATQKGTGKDISIAALELSVPATVVHEAISSRFLSCMIDERRRAAKQFNCLRPFAGDMTLVLSALRDALYCAQLIAYIQGLLLMVKASTDYNWSLDLAKITRVWKNGCIIQSDLLNALAVTVCKKAGSTDFLSDPKFREVINHKQAGWRNTIITAVQHGIPVPALSSALAYFDGLCSERLPANLIQAQRDYFGSHGHERVDALRGAFFHLKRDKKDNEVV